MSKSQKPIPKKYQITKTEKKEKFWALTERRKLHDDQIKTNENNPI